MNLMAAPPVVVPATVAAAAVDFSVVVPFRNPGPMLRRTVEQLRYVLRAQGITFEVIAVSEGSTDGSAAGLGDIAEARVIASGDICDKGAALEAGFAVAGGAWIGFVDLDGDDEVDPYEVVETLHRAREQHALVAQHALAA